MNKSRDADPDIAPEYDFSGGRRGTYLARARRGIRVIAHSAVSVVKPADRSIPDKPKVDPPKRKGA